MNRPVPRWALYVALVVLYVLHNDLWFWNDAQLVLGLPVGLVYHIGFAMAASILMILLVKYAWPHHLEVDDETEHDS